MDLRQFIVELTQALVWPLLLFYFVHRFSREITALFQRIQGLNFRSGEISFNEALARAEEHASNLLLSQTKECIDVSATERDQINQFQKLAELEPAAAVMIAWKKLEREVRSFYRESELENKKLGSPVASIIKHLIDADLIDAQFGAVLRELWKLRNVATHAENHQISTEKAIDYAWLCFSLGGSLRDGLIGRDSSSESLN